MVTTVSYSELDALRQCPMKHHLAYRHRWTSLTASPALERGSKWHLVMKTHYTTLMEGGGYADALKNVASLLQAYVADSDPDAELLTWMYDGYTDLYSWDPDWQVLYVEHPIEFPIPTPSGNPSHFRLKGIVDLVVQERSTGNIWLVDHKTGKNLPRGRDTEMDDQFAIYTWLLRRSGMKIFGCVYNACRTYQLVRPMTADERFQRIKMFRTDRELEIMVQEVWRTFRRYSRNDLGLPERIPDSDRCGWRCPFTEPCLMSRKTGDTRLSELMEQFGFIQDFTRH